MLISLTARSRRSVITIIDTVIDKCYCFYYHDLFVNSSNWHVTRDHRVLWPCHVSVLVGLYWWVCTGGSVLVGLYWWVYTGGSILVGLYWWVYTAHNADINVNLIMFSFIITLHCIIIEIYLLIGTLLIHCCFFIVHVIIYLFTHEYKKNGHLIILKNWGHLKIIYFHQFCKY